MKTHDHFSLLKRCPFFANMTQEAIWSVLQHAELRHFSARQTIFRAGDPSDGLYVVASGRVAITIADGPNMLQLSVIEPPAALGVVGAIDGEPRTATATAETDCELLLIYRRDLEKIGDAFPALWRSAATAMAMEARRIATHEQALLLTRGERLARWLLAAADGDGIVSATQDQLALAVGTHRTVVARLLAAWRAAGLIASRRGAVLIQDRAGLAAAAR